MTILPRLDFRLFSRRRRRRSRRNRTGRAGGGGDWVRGRRILHRRSSIRIQRRGARRNSLTFMGHEFGTFGLTTRYPGAPRLESGPQSYAVPPISRALDDDRTNETPRRRPSILYGPASP